MPSKCPPGVICIENITLLVVVLVCFVIYTLYKIFVQNGYYYNNSSTSSNSKPLGNNSKYSPISALFGISSKFQSTDSPPDNPPVHKMLFDVGLRDHHMYNNGHYHNHGVDGIGHIHYNPNPHYGTGIGYGGIGYGYGHGHIGPRIHEIGVVPVNIPTRGSNEPFVQRGMLTRKNGDDMVLPLMGRPLLANRNKWQYYTVHEKTGMRLPISSGGRDCDYETGCDELYDGDSVYVQGLDDVFYVRMMKNMYF
jgi:hypothetical protein